MGGLVPAVLATASYTSILFFFFLQCEHWTVIKVMGNIRCHCILAQTAHYMVRTLRLTYIVIVKQLIPPTWVESGHNFVEQAIQDDQDLINLMDLILSEKEW